MGVSKRSHSRWLAQNSSFVSQSPVPSSQSSTNANHANNSQNNAQSEATITSSRRDKKRYSLPGQWPSFTPSIASTPNASSKMTASATSQPGNLTPTQVSFRGPLVNPKLTPIKENDATTEEDPDPNVDDGNDSFMTEASELSFIDPVQRSDFEDQRSNFEDSQSDEEELFDGDIVLRDAPRPGPFHGVWKPPLRTPELPCTHATQGDTQHAQRVAVILQQEPGSEDIYNSLMQRVERMIRTENELVTHGESARRTCGDLTTKLYNFLKQIADQRVVTGEERTMIELEQKWAYWIDTCAQKGVLHLKTPGCICKRNWGKGLDNGVVEVDSEDEAGYPSIEMEMQRKYVFTHE
ncbi:hypothetical protein BU24DRAFT_464968 [Aaosphaeria arxii CBS 175.79]|uniref:Uncharacterized protein n=1 Tax=Aaosphaeria arxii CBS 175.79 TaxID=1450172 RepID=A0A6A5XHK0_9PLEO|nr:uncharacterized protein BU24DRAFT_464968 [Aaosphaeria arxii CBS 175.79]KAF2012592.1 hypothetical protein BU24DRAFT_464968 [Aaosphaeria arxii CBS 175.79]